MIETKKRVGELRNAGILELGKKPFANHAWINASIIINNINIDGILIIIINIKYFVH